MGAALYIVLERQISGVDTMIDGKALSRAEKQLSRAAKRLGVRPLMEFFSADPEEVEGFLSGEGVEPSEVEIPSEQWFSAEDGLTSVRALLSAVETSPDLQATKTDLLEFERVLSEAQKHGVRWHLAVDF
ncbi:MAG: hypothetical protein HZC16_01585 [Candidatus Omnitrophica bacterium]|nr:hypothetical protein [Candidatus Omnitrophota bacterium]